MNEQIVNIAKSALKSGPFETRTTYCLRFVREVVQVALGSKYDDYWKATAKLTGLAFQNTDFDAEEPLAPGDLLFKLYNDGEAGHVGIYVGNNNVIENSSRHQGRIRGAIGEVDLSIFGNYDLVVRLT